MINRLNAVSQSYPLISSSIEVHDLQISKSPCGLLFTFFFLFIQLFCWGILIALWFNLVPLAGGQTFVAFIKIYYF